MCIRDSLGKVWLALVFLFLYAPLAFMILFSFNSTRQPDFAQVFVEPIRHDG